MSAFETALIGRRIIVTGHTGFKGCWLAHWLAEIGADVHGIALAPEGQPNMFDATGLKSIIHHNVIDIRDSDAMIDRFVAIDPEVVFHLAAQSLVRRSYDEPLMTFETNTLGTAYVLEACRRSPSIRAIVCITTDKVYENREWDWAYREIDALGGKDPYSASKAAAEIIAACYRDSFLATGNAKGLATARGGNVIGGGDWSDDRLIPDLVRAISDKKSMMIRNPNSSRPWQHVLTLCHGYLELAARLLDAPEKYHGAWNFGPGTSGTVTVAKLLQHFKRAWELPEITEQEADGKPESKLLAVDSSKARHRLEWVPPWSLEHSVARTAEWYQGFDKSPSDALKLTRKQISEYRSDLAALSD